MQAIYWLLAFSAAVAIAVFLLIQALSYSPEVQTTDGRLIAFYYIGLGEVVAVGLAAVFFMAFLDTSGLVPINF